MKGGIMNSKEILDSINDVNLRIEKEYNKWNETDDIHLIEECIWSIKSLEVRRNNLYIKAKTLNLSNKNII